MERYFLLIFDGLSTEEKSFLWNYFGVAEITSEKQLLFSTLFYRSSYVYFINLKKELKKNAEWRKIDTAHNIKQLVSECGEDVGDNSKNGDVHNSSSIAECINSLADHLPLPGSFLLDVVVGCNIFKTFEVSDNIEFAVSLHRLSEWHSARTAWLSLKTDVISEFKAWLDLTNAEAIYIDVCLQSSIPFWRGAIEFNKDPNMSTQCCKGFEFQINHESTPMHYDLSFIFNLSNDKDYLLLHPVLKVIDICSFSSIPQHLILPVALKLYVRGSEYNDNSQKLCANIKEKHGAAVIVRMGFSVLKEKPKPDKALGTSKWLKRVSSGNLKYDNSCFPEPDNYLTLAIVPSSDSDDMLAYVIRHSSCFDPQFIFNAASIHSKQTFNPLENSVKVKEISMPYVSKPLFLSLLQKVTSMHTELNDSSNHEENFSSKNTNDLLNSFIQRIDSPELLNCYRNFNDVNAIYEEIDPSDWAERISLLQRQIRLDREKISKSNVFMSFSPKRSRYYVSFSGDDIKKYFDSSGEAKDNKITEPIESLGYNMNYNKDSLETIQQKKWPDILKCVHDDIYYNVTRQSEENENLRNEMVKCYIQHETASTCNNHQNQPDAPISIQAKSMTPRKKPKGISKSKTSFRQVITNPDTRLKEKFLKTAEVKSNPVISTIMKTLDVTSNTVSNQSNFKRRIPRKSVPVRCSPRKKSFYSSSRGVNVTNKVEKAKTAKDNSHEEILKKKLRSAIASALESNGINIDDALFKPCFKRLFTICQVFVQDIQHNPRKLGTSQYIQEIAEEHVKPVIKFEKEKKKIK